MTKSKLHFYPKPETKFKRYVKINTAVSLRYYVLPIGVSISISLALVKSLFGPGSLSFVFLHFVFEQLDLQVELLSLQEQVSFLQSQNLLVHDGGQRGR